MKRSIVCLFGILALGACSENGAPDTKGPDESKTGGRFLTVGIADAGTTRAGADGYESGRSDSISSTARAARSA